MIFVTGGTGLIGSRLLFQLALGGNNVTALKRNHSSLTLFHHVFAGKPSLKDKITWVVGDITDVDFLSGMIDENAEVYHCAGLVSFDPADRDKLYHANICGTENIVNVCLANKIRKLVHVSSVGALGRSDNIYIDESSHWEISKHTSDYSISKYAAEREVWRGMAEGLEAVIVNPSVVIGAGTSAGGSADLIAKVDKGLHFYTDGSSGFVDADDVASVMIKLMQGPFNSERYIVSSENISYLDLFKTIALKLNRKSPSIKATRKMAGAYVALQYIKSKISGSRPLITKFSAQTAFMHYNYSNEKVKNALQYSFIPVKKSIESACEAYLRLKKQTIPVVFSQQAIP